MEFLFYPFNVLLWLFFTLSSAVFFLIALLLFTITYPFDPNRRILQQFSCFWASIYLWINPFWSVKIVGRKNYDPKRRFVVVSNHASMADILVLFRTFLHFKWVSKASVFKTPFLGWNMRLNGYIPIERGDAESRERCMDRARDWLAKGSSVLFFPEGTRSKQNDMLPFKPGAFRLALETKHDILPVVIRGSGHAIPAHSLFLTRRSHIEVEILPPIDVAPFLKEDLREATPHLMDFVRETMARKVSNHAPAHSSASAS